MNELLENIATLRLMPLMRIDEVEVALPLAQAFVDGGVNCMAITVNGKDCMPGLEAIRKECGEMIIGAGDVMTVEQARTAISSGARFILMPVNNPKVIEFCITADIPVIPGCCTPSEFAVALQAGAEVINYFPAEALGGVRILAAVSGPFEDAKFIAINGVEEHNVREYLSFHKILACGIKWVATPELIAARDFEEIRRLTAEAVELVRTV